jgi:hypothetical protein
MTGKKRRGGKAAEPLTTTRVVVGDFSKAEPEWCRVPDVFRIFGIRRGSLYNLLKDGEIKSVCLRRRGYKQGQRLIQIASVRDFLNRLQTQSA